MAWRGQAVEAGYVPARLGTLRRGLVPAQTNGPPFGAAPPIENAEGLAMSNRATNLPRSSKRQEPQKTSDRSSETLAEMLTTSEIASLRQSARENSAFYKEAFADVKPEAS